jgi:catechol 2,3-dioxygenase-like lactoylglutathione lyase family enzyme
MAETGASTTASSMQYLHHIGITVANLDAALAFWESFLQKPARWKTVLDRPYLGRITGYPGVSIKAAFVDLPGGVVVELLDYQVEGRVPNTDVTANPGNVHLCLKVEDAAQAWNRAVACGARPLTEGPIDIDGGPNIGARAAYLRGHDGVTIELFQAPKAAA